MWLRQSGLKSAHKAERDRAEGGAQGLTGAVSPEALRQEKRSALRVPGV